MYEPSKAYSKSNRKHTHSVSYTALVCGLANGLQVGNYQMKAWNQNLKLIPNTGASYHKVYLTDSS